MEVQFDLIWPADELLLWSVFLDVKPHTSNIHSIYTHRKNIYLSSNLWLFVCILYVTFVATF